MNDFSCSEEYKEAFALFDKRGTGAVPRDTLGDLLRALGQNPTQAEVAEIVNSSPRDGKSIEFSSSLTGYPFQSTIKPFSKF
jgi:Ca2+-binding EF-hand superfamily protein